MKRIISRSVYFMLEPYSKSCPRCNALMRWDTWQGPLGGWKCPTCGLKVDNK